MKNVIVTLAEILLGIALFMLITGIGLGDNKLSLNKGATSVFDSIVGNMQESISSDITPDSGN